MDSCDGIGGRANCFEERVVGMLHLVLGLAGIASLLTTEIPMLFLLYLAIENHFALTFREVLKQYGEERRASL